MQQYAIAAFCFRSMLGAPLSKQLVWALGKIVPGAFQVACSCSVRRLAQMVASVFRDALQKRVIIGKLQMDGLTFLAHPAKITSNFNKTEPNIY